MHCSGFYLYMCLALATRPDTVEYLGLLSLLGEIVGTRMDYIVY